MGLPAEIDNVMKPVRTPRLDVGRAAIARVRQHRELVSALAFFVVLLTVFTVASPTVFLNPLAYKAVAISLPVSMILAVTLVFVIVSGEIDLSFPSIIGLSALVFTQSVTAGLSPYLGLVLAAIAGMVAGFINGLLVTYAGLSSLVATLGMNFLWRGLIDIITQGQGTPLSALSQTSFYTVFVGELGGIPVQMLWGTAFVVVAVLLFTRHKFGAQVCCVGDNLEAAREMGINVRAVKIMTFVYVGLASGFAGVLLILINNTFWPTVGDGYLLSVLAAVFVGGTPTWGGVGTVAGAAIGACTVGFIETGIIASGLTGFFTQFFYGMVIVVSLLSHRLNRPRQRRAVGHR
jgi:simple sugar transport system permease protein